MLAAPGSKGARGAFFVSSAISATGPYLLFYLLCFWYAYDTIIYPRDENGTLYTEVLSYNGWYVYAKVFLTFAGTAINTFLTYEMVTPIYKYWQILRQLEETVPYVRPTEEEVARRDTVLEEEDDGETFDSNAFSFDSEVFDF